MQKKIFFLSIFVSATIFLSACEMSTVNAAGNIEQELRSASQNLLFPSETDAPIQVFAWNEGEFSLDKLLTKENFSPAEKVKMQSLEEFFSGVTATEDWFNDKEKAKAEKFARLQTAISLQLREVKVYQIGEKNISVFIVGKSADGRILGLRTELTET